MAVAAGAAVAIRVDHVSKRYPVDGGRSQLAALDGIELSVETGEFVSLVGPSGCGKTTLLKMIAGLVPCEEGRIAIRGREVKGVPPNVGFVFQEPGLLPWRSVFRNVELALEAKAASRDAKRRTIERYLAMMGLSRFGGYPPYQLSGGMQQRVGLARALAVEPDVLFMDEPFGSLDALTRARLQEELAGVVETTGTTTLFVTHDVDEAVYLSDRVVVLSARPGRLQAVLDVPLARPRNRAAFRRDQAVTHLRGQILELIESQSWETPSAS
jgi:NitT/TauT family transport system ATP-binding protein